MVNRTIVVWEKVSRVRKEEHAFLFKIRPVYRLTSNL